MAKTYPIRNSPRHARDKDYASALAELDHLLCSCLRSHHHTCDVDSEHAIRILGRVFQGWRFLLNPSSCYQSIKPPLLIGNLLDNLV